MKIVHTCLLLCGLLLAVGSLRAAQPEDGDRYSEIAAKVDVSVRLNVEWPNSSLRIRISNRSDTTLAFLPFNMYLTRLQWCKKNVDIHRATGAALSTLIPWRAQVDTMIPDGCDREYVRWYDMPHEVGFPKMAYWKYYVVQPVPILPGTTAEFSMEANERTPDSLLLAAAARECIIDTFSLPLYVVDSAFRARMGEDLVQAMTPSSVYTMESRDVGPAHLGIRQNFILGSKSHVVIDSNDWDLLRRRKLLVRGGRTASCTCVVGPPTDGGE
jgi:hypothetical protein